MNEEETTTYNQKVEKQTWEIIRVMKPALQRKHGKYPTEWRNKTEQGLKAAIFHILVAVDWEAKSGSWKEVRWRMCDFEDFDVISRYTRAQAVADGILIELLRWKDKPVMATTHLVREVSRGQLLDVWEQFKVWKEKVEQTLPEEERLFHTGKNGKKIWVIEDPEAYTLMYPEDY